MLFAHASSVIFPKPIGSALWIPALITASQRPYLATVAATRPSTSPPFVQSATCAIPSLPSATMASVTVWQLSASFDTETTFAPCRASTIEVIAPMP